VRTIYLDNNATTRPLPEVVEAMERALREQWANPSSIHRPGQAARQAVELARRDLATLIGAKPRNLTFTGSGTEAIDLAIRGSLLAQGRIGAKRTREAGAVITTGVEHSAVRELCDALVKQDGVRVLHAGLDSCGAVRMESVRELLDANTDVALVSVQWANNETGVVHPVGEIARLCRERGVVFHCDATQWVGKMETCVDAANAAAMGLEQAECVCEADVLTFSAHKFHGPKGVGMVYLRSGSRLTPLIHGEQEMGRRGGTENVPGIVGAGVAARLANEWLQKLEERKRLGALRDEFERLVIERVPDAVVNGMDRHGSERRSTQSRSAQDRLWNTTNIGFPRLEAEALLLLLSERGVCASAGAACSSGSLEPSVVLRTMGVPAEVAHGSLRFSLSRETTEDEIVEAAEIVGACVGRLRGSMSAVG
jgi:cysteine desulfurase